MINLRKYGDPPYRAAVVHGGPGACGDLAPVARELSSVCGILEPIQTEITLDGQIEELKTILLENGDLPIILIGHSWGAWLCYFIAALHPQLVRKLILVGSGPYEQRYADNMKFANYSDSEKVEFDRLISVLHDPNCANKGDVYAKLGAMVRKADAYDLLPDEEIWSDPVDSEGREYSELLEMVIRMRRDKKLIEFAHRIECPVVAIHGDTDRHPHEGVETPLSSILTDFRMILLNKCGHNPWTERYARDEFYRVLREELQSV